MRRKVSISLGEVEREISELRTRLAEAEAVRNYLRRQTEPEEDGASDLGESARVNWAERINGFLSQNAGQRFTINDLFDRLAAETPELKGATDPASVLRATLNRYAHDYAWMKERQGRAMLWFKEPAAERA